MKKGLTELVFIVDRSGSMAGLEKDTIGGFNAMLKEQAELEGEARVTTVLFDNQYRLLHDRIDIRAVAPLTEKDYRVGGGTALLDAIGRTIKKIRAVQKQTAEDYRAEKVLFVIITDGEENSSRKYSAEQIILYPRMWTHRKKGWGKTLAKHCSDENGFRQCESFFMDRSRCRKLPLRLTEKPISMDSFKNVEFLEHGQSKKVWNPCNKTLVQGSESFRMDKVATVDER